MTGNRSTFHVYLFSSHQDEVEECCLVNLDKLGVPRIDILLTLCGLLVYLLAGSVMELAVLDDLKMKQ